MYTDLAGERVGKSMKFNENQWKLMKIYEKAMNMLTFELVLDHGNRAIIRIPKKV